MKKEYDFSKSKKNPYAKHLKQQITIRLDKSTVEYFKHLSQESGIAYQVLINLFLKDCAASKKKPKLKWDDAA
ncbi:MAG: BrnA antitoxin family protein [Bdellovibrionota bacterium]